MSVFKIEKKDPSSSARAGVLKTDHGQIETPIFMPVGTRASVKGISQRTLEESIKAQIVLGNTYHLYLKPGSDIIEAAGGLHKFMSWDKPILTDSGGYQVYSLSDRRKIKEEGATFSSHIDGSKHLFTPERAIDIQRQLGADIIMAFDECTPYPCEYNYAKRSMGLTHRWLDRCCTHMDKQESLHEYQQIFAPIVQGSVYKDLRMDSAKFIRDKDRKINAIGGLSVGEPKDILYEMTEVVCGILPEEKPRYLMGVGTPENLLECIALGIDMFDCVLPSRNARHGLIYTGEGIINIKNKKWEQDFSPVDPTADIEEGTKYTKAYVRHLIHVKEAFGASITTTLNLRFYLRLMEEARAAIIEDRFSSWKKDKLEKITRRL